MWKKLTIGFIVLAAACISFFSFRHHPGEYKLNLPEKAFVLPEELHEISGIVPLNDNELACVQDESATIYIYDLRVQKITRQYKTNIIGDFEGITLAGNSIYILRSDGMLDEYADYTSPGTKMKEYFLNLPSANNEGLCYDQKNYRLLIAAKIQANGKAKKEKRYIYSFDLRTKVPNNVPIIKLDVDDIEKLAISEGLAVAEKTGKKEKKKDNAFNFRPSEIAVHPFNKNIYILAAADKFLLILNADGDLKHLYKLDPILFNKAEGLAFLQDGTMLVSNEGQKGEPTLLEFKYGN
ncbi:MAG: hypothetical protein ACJ77K_15420 [Bacteroidia bacterium]